MDLEVPLLSGSEEATPSRYTMKRVGHVGTFVSFQVRVIAELESEVLVSGTQNGVLGAANREAIMNKLFFFLRKRANKL